MRTFRRILTAPLYAVAAIIVLLEDWLWDDLQRIAALIGHLPVFRQVEGLIVRAPRGVALLLFLIPSLVLIPVKLLALYFISGGHALLGLATIIAAKIAGTALVARLFTITKPKLLTFTWFRWLYERIMAFKSRVYTTIRSSALYQLVHSALTRLRAGFKEWRSEKKSWLRRRWQAILRHRRRSGAAEPGVTSVHTTSAQADAESVKNPAPRGKRASRPGYSGARRAKKSPRSHAKPRRARP